MDGQLWSVALLLSRLLGEAAATGTAAAMVQQCIAQGAPLQTLLLLLGGASVEQPLAAAAAAAIEAAAPASEAPPAAAWQQQPGMFNPAASAAGPRPGSSSDPTAWRRQLAVMAANRTPGDEGAMLSLGSQLLAVGQLLPAHTAFVLAGALLQPWDLAAAGSATNAGGAAPADAGKHAPPPLPLVLLGMDAAGRPRACAQLSAILATEVYTWSRTVGELPAAMYVAPGTLAINTTQLACCMSVRVGCRRHGDPKSDARTILRGIVRLLEPLRWPAPCLQATPRCLGSTCQWCRTSCCTLMRWQSWDWCSRLPPTARAWSARCRCAGRVVEFQPRQQSAAVSCRLLQPISVEQLPVALSWQLMCRNLFSVHIPQHSTSCCPQALGGKVPPGLLVCRAVAADLRDRLQQYATVSAGRSTGWEAALLCGSCWPCAVVAVSGLQECRFEVRSLLAQISPSTPRPPPAPAGPEAVPWRRLHSGGAGQQRGQVAGPRAHCNDGWRRCSR